jgi:hypothetical protein
MEFESFNRLENPSQEDFDRFVGWLFSHTLSELQAARGDLAATRAAWIGYFQKGLRAELLLDELARYLPELFKRVHYPAHEGRQVLAMIKALDLLDFGIRPPGPGGTPGQG